MFVLLTVDVIPHTCMNSFSLQESLRYKDNATSIIQNLCKCMQAFNDVEAFVRAWDVFELSHCPYRGEKQISKTQHYKVRLLML